MEEIKLSVKGSSSTPYELIFIKDGDSLTALCTCPAGSFGGLCKHRVAILEGDSSAVVGDNADKVPSVVSWMAGTDVEVALKELRETESLKDVPKEDIAAAKKKLARAMNS